MVREFPPFLPINRISDTDRLPESSGRRPFVLHIYKSEEVTVIEKSLEELRQELEHAQTKERQYAHQAERIRNRMRYNAKGERKQRAHHLITRGAAIESVAPMLKDMGEVEFYSLVEKIVSLPEVSAIITQAVSENAPTIAREDG